MTTRQSQISFPWRPGLVAAGIALLLASPAGAAPVIFSDSGADAADIQNTVDAFRAALASLPATRKVA